MQKLFALAATAVLAAASQAQIYTQGFDDVTTLAGSGWVFSNQSTTLGSIPAGFFQGNDTVFPAQSGAATSYLGTNFNAGGGLSTLSVWMVLPELQVKDGDTMSFYTRTVDTPSFPDRLQVRTSAATGFSTGTGPNATGTFSNLLLDINPTYTTSGFPNAWTQFNITFSGIGQTLTPTRIAFRYFVENGGPSGINSDYIGIDTLEVVPEPGTMAALGLGAAALLRRRRKA